MMKLKFNVILSISKTHLLSRKKQSIIAALGVTFGIAAYVIMMSFMTGLNGMLDSLILNRTPHIHMYNEVVPSETQPVDQDLNYKGSHSIVHSIRPKQNQTKIHNANAIINFLNDQDYVKVATPLVKTNAFYIGGSTKLNGMLSGVDVLKETENYALNDYVVDGNAYDLAVHENGILLGKGAAKKLSLSVGDLVQISNAYGDLFQLKIVGFYQSGIAEIDNVQSYVNLSTAQRIMNVSSSYITDVNVKLHDMEQAPQISKSLEKMYDITAVDIQTANAEFETGVSIRNMISYAVSITLLIVAGFGIYNILNMFIYEKMNDIAILKATGFSGKDVRRIFLSQALLIGIVGGILGLLVGFLVSYMISQAPFETEALPTIKKMPVNFDPMFYFIGVTFALISTFFAGYLPAKKAQNIDPVDIIRGQ